MALDLTELQIGGADFIPGDAALKERKAAREASKLGDADHFRLCHLTSLACCGIKEIHALRLLTDECKGSAEVLKYIVKELGMGRFSCAYLIFSEVDGKGTYGQDLAAAIQEKGFGNVIQANSRRNPNSGNKLNVWLWELDRKAIRRYFQATFPNEPTLMCISSEE